MERARQNDREYYSKNKERLIEYQRQYAAENPEKRATYLAEYTQRPENKSRILQSKQEYRERNEERLRLDARERARKSRAENPEIHREALRRWRKANPEKRSADYNNRRAVKIPAPGQHTAQDIIALYTAQKGQCAGCNTAISNRGKLRYHIDHIKPLRPRNGDTPGSNGPENLQLLCRFCNQTKNNMSMEKWLSRRMA